MKNLQLIPDSYRQQPFLWARFATHLLKQGTDLRYIQELLGYGNSKTTKVYTRVSKKSLANIKNPLDAILDN